MERCFEGFEENADSDANEQFDRFERDTHIAMTLSMLEKYRPQRDDVKDDIGLVKSLLPLSPGLPPMSPVLSDCSSDLHILSDQESPRPSPGPYIPKINDIIPALHLDVLSSPEVSRPISPTSKMSPDVMIISPEMAPTNRCLKRVHSTEETSQVDNHGGKCLKLDSRRTSADSQGSNRSSVGADFWKSFQHYPSEALDLPRVPCLTRRQSRELSRIIHGKDSLKDRRSIHYSLDPSIFDPEISDDDSDFDDLHILPEVKEELEEILLPRQLDPYTYNEQGEFVDELPDLVNISDDENVSSPPSSPQSSCEDQLPIPRSLANVTPVFDKLMSKPLVVLKDCMADVTKNKITKKLKLKSDPSTSPSRLSPSKLVWTLQQRTKLQDICSRVQIKLTRCDQRGEQPKQQQPGGMHIADTETGLLADDLEHYYHDDHMDTSPDPTVYFGDSSGSDSDEDEDEKKQLKEQKRLVQLEHSGMGRVVVASSRNEIEPSTVTPNVTCSRESLSLGRSLHAERKLQMESSASTDIPQVQPLNVHLLNIIENCDTEGEKFQLRFLDLVKSNLSPWTKVSNKIAEILFQLLLHTNSRLVAWKCYNLLTSILSFESGVCASFKWEDLENNVEKLKLPLGIHNCSVEDIFGPALALQYMVSVLECDLIEQASHSNKSHQLHNYPHHHQSSSSHRYVMKSQAFEWLSVDRGFRYVAKVIDWTIAALNYGQYSSISSPMSKRKLNFLGSVSSEKRRAQSKTNISQVPRLLPLFQRLLNLSVIVSRRKDECVQRIATEIVRGYMHTPLAFHRQLLMTTIESPLLKFKLVQQILEDYGATPDTDPCHGPSITLQEIFDTYVHYEPPLTTLTPPLTPNEHDDDNDRDDAAADDGHRTGHGKVEKRNGKYSPDSVEELCVLMYHLVYSYISVTNLDFGEDLKRMDDFVGALKSRYKSLTSEVTPKTELYLTMMAGLKEKTS